MIIAHRYKQIMIISISYFTQPAFAYLHILSRHVRAEVGHDKKYPHPSVKFLFTFTMHIFLTRVRHVFSKHQTLLSAYFFYDRRNINTAYAYNKINSNIASSSNRNGLLTLESSQPSGYKNDEYVSHTRTETIRGGRKKSRFPGTHKDQARVTMRIFRNCAHRSEPLSLTLGASPEFGRNLNNVCIFVFLALEQRNQTKCMSPSALSCCSGTAYRSFTVLLYSLYAICVSVVAERTSCMFGSNPSIIPSTT